MASAARTYGDVTLEMVDGPVGVAEIHRPPDNFFDVTLIASLADALGDAVASGARAALVCSEGKHFCAGAKFAPGGDQPLDTAHDLYAEAARLFDLGLPMVAAVQGAAVGGGLGLALAADFRVAAPEARFAANFARLGIHQGFGISVTLPRVIGTQRALELLLTGRRVDGTTALSIGLCDRLAPLEGLRGAALDVAAEIAAAAPLAVASIRSTMRGALADEVRAAMAHERAEQLVLARTEDHAEGVAASAARRTPRFRGR
ncbi:MAG TPA: enoyl-CoA hydratase/isomerase family protein [Acidimicrobiales bacterium]|nr:enoyl-CoA hydratase/isomerase family protein [Acidimicrobiales bacterium]